MSRKAGSRMIAGLDIGTSKVVAIVGEVDPFGGRIEILGVGSSPSRGLKKGVVVNIESTVSSIQRAVEAAEQMADCRFPFGLHQHCRQSHRQPQFATARCRSVTMRCVPRMSSGCWSRRGRCRSRPTRKILHVLPQDFIIDNQEGIRQPVGMSGVRLEAKVHIITCALSAAQNIS